MEGFTQNVNVILDAKSLKAIKLDTIEDSKVRGAKAYRLKEDREEKTI